MTSYKFQKQHASNYNYKGKRSFGQRIKNFFTIPEEDLKEEESPNFERVKLFALNRARLFAFLTLFFLIVNILIIFDLNIIYLRQILGFLFLILIPGLLIMLCFKIRTVKFWEYLVYTVGLSIAFIMFAGLAVNWTLPALGITDKPLSLWPILISFDIFLIILGFVAWKKNKDLEHEFTTPKLDTLNNLFFIIPMAFPLLSVLGAFLLNNHGPNILTMIMLGGIAIYVLLLVIFRKHMNENVWPWALWMIGLALLLSGWMRSWFVSGTDISLEYWVFQLTKENNLWKIFNFTNSYDVMLSLTIFPNIISNFININNQFIFKLLIPIIFSLISILIYLISRKILPYILSFFSVLLFIFMPDFMNGFSTPIRQEIAFLFFGLMLLVLFNNKIKTEIKKLFFFTFGISMIVSHYSTSYIALAIFVLTYIFILIYKMFEKQKISNGKLHQSQKSEFFLTGTLILLLIIFGFLWYNQVTSTANGLIDFAGTSISNLRNIFNEEIRQGGPSDPVFGIFNNQIPVADYIEAYKNQSFKYDLSNTSQGFPREEYSEYQIRYLQIEILPSKIKFINNFYNINYYIKQILSKIFQLFILIGLFYFIFKKNIKNDLKSIFIGSSTMIILLLFLPSFSYNYGLTRSILQIMILLSALSILGGGLFFKKIKINSIFLLYILLILFFLFFSGFNSQLTGGDSAKMQLNNFGGDYDISYMFNQDFFGVKWLDNYHQEDNVYSDVNSIVKINSYGGYFSLYNVNRHILPNTISKKGYVYLSTINNIKNIGVFSIRNTKISYNYPKDFITNNKNKIYSNGGSEIFK